MSICDSHEFHRLWFFSPRSSACPLFSQHSPETTIFPRNQHIQTWCQMGVELNQRDVFALMGPATTGGRLCSRRSIKARLLILQNHVYWAKDHPRIIQGSSKDHQVVQTWRKQQAEDVPCEATKTSPSCSNCLALMDIGVLKGLKHPDCVIHTLKFLFDHFPRFFMFFMIFDDCFSNFKALLQISRCFFTSCRSWIHGSPGSGWRWSETTWPRRLRFPCFRFFRRFDDWQKPAKL